MEGQRFFVVYSEKGNYSDYRLAIIGIASSKEIADRWVDQCEALETPGEYDDNAAYTVQEIEIDKGLWCEYICGTYPVDDEESVNLT